MFQQPILVSSLSLSINIENRTRAIAFGCFDLSKDSHVIKLGSAHCRVIIPYNNSGLIRYRAVGFLMEQDFDSNSAEKNVSDITSFCVSTARQHQYRGNAGNAFHERVALGFETDFQSLTKELVFAKLYTDRRTPKCNERLGGEGSVSQTLEGFTFAPGQAHFGIILHRTINGKQGYWNHLQMFAQIQQMGICARRPVLGQRIDDGRHRGITLPRRRGCAQKVASAPFSARLWKTRNSA